MAGGREVAAGGAPLGPQQTPVVFSRPAAAAAVLRTAARKLRSGSRGRNKRPRLAEPMRTGSPSTRRTRDVGQQPPNFSGARHGVCNGCGNEVMVALPSGNVPSTVAASTTCAVQAGPQLCPSGCSILNNTDNQGRPCACIRPCNFHQGHPRRCSSRQCYGGPTG